MKIYNTHTGKIYVDQERYLEFFMDTKPHPYIRKLSPRECGRCQGFSEDFIDNVLNTVSVTQAYKQFGNAVCPPVIEKIFGHLYFNFCEY